MRNTGMAAGLSLMVAFLLAVPHTGAQAEEEQITFTKHISRILQNNCQECHRPEGVAPLALVTYRQAKGWAPMVREVVETKRMPPWHADPHVGKFKNDRRLSDAEVRQVIAWMDSGYPQGDPADMPEPLEFVDEWRIGQPDVVFEMPEPYEVQATGVVPYEHIVIPTNFEEDKWVRAMDCRAGNAKVVHHILVFARGAEHEHSEVSDFLRIGKGFLVGFAPGTIPVDLPDGYAFKIPKGADLIFQMHYTPTGKPEVDQSKLGIIFADEPPIHEIQTATTVNFQFEIPPHADNYEVVAESTFPKNAVLYSMTPHMHYRGKSYEYTAIFPDGTQETFLRVPRFDFNWQTTYILEEPIFVPQGTVMRTVAHFDNSANNPANPDPTRPIRWGDQTWEEMMIGWMNVSFFEGSKEDYQKLMEEKFGENASIFGGKSAKQAETSGDGTEQLHTAAAK